MLCQDIVDGADGNVCGNLVGDDLEGCSTLLQCSSKNLVFVVVIYLLGTTWTRLIGSGTYFLVTFDDALCSVWIDILITASLSCIPCLKSASNDTVLCWGVNFTSFGVG